MLTDCISAVAIPPTAILDESIKQAQADPEDDAKFAAAVHLLRQQQLRRDDVQRKLAAIVEKRGRRW